MIRAVDYVYPCISASINPLSPLFFYIYHVAHHVREYKYDVIHSHTNTDTSYYFSSKEKRKAH